MNMVTIGNGASVALPNTHTILGFFIDNPPPPNGRWRLLRQRFRARSPNSARIDLE